MVPRLLFILGFSVVTFIFSYLVSIAFLKYKDNRTSFFNRKALSITLTVIAQPLIFFAAASLLFYLVKFFTR